jgi:hypothetical protein
MVDLLKKLYFFWFFVCLGLHQRNDDFAPVTGEFLQNFKKKKNSILKLPTKE